MNNDQTKTQYLNVLQIFRGIVALMVIIFFSAASLKYYDKINYLLTISTVILLTSIFFYLKYNAIEFFEFSSNLIFAVFVFSFLYLSIFYLNVKCEKTNLMMIIGNATYSIYLVRNSLQMIIIKYFPRINSVLGVFLILSVMKVTSCFFRLSVLFNC